MCIIVIKNIMLMMKSVSYNYEINGMHTDSNDTYWNSHSFIYLVQSFYYDNNKLFS